MKKILIFISLLLTYVSQGQISDAKITDTIALWIVPNLTKSITAAQMNAILDHLNNSKINKDSIVNVRTNAAEDTLWIKYKTTLDTIVLGGANHWTLTGNDIANNNSGKVTLPKDSTYFSGIPDEATKVGRLAHINQYGKVEWVSPATLSDTLAYSGGGIWYRDSTQGFVYLIDTNDLVGIGTTTPQNTLYVKGSINATDYLHVGATNSLFDVDAIGGIGVPKTFFSLLDSNYFAGKVVVDSGLYVRDSVGIGTATPIERLDVQNGNINLDTSSATSGQIKQNGNTVFHTYCTVTNQANLFIGQTSGNYTNTSSMNIAIGPGLMTMLSSGFGNSVINGGDLISSGHYNNYFGYGSGVSTSTGSANIGIGAYAMPFNSSGSYNTCIGYRAGYKETGSYKYYVAMDSTSWANGMASGSKLLMYADQSNAAKSNHFLNIFAKVSIGAAKNPNEMLSVTGNASITGYLKSGTGSIADNDSTPSVASYNTFIYAGSANPVSIDALDDHVIGCYYTIIGNSNTYTITVIDGTPAGGDSFNLAGGNWVGGSQDVLLLYCIAADAFVEVSRSDN